MDKVSLAMDIKFGESEIKAITINMSSGSICGDNWLINRLIKVNDRLKPTDTDTVWHWSHFKTTLGNRNSSWRDQLKN